MGNRTDKPKQTAQQLIAKMKNEKGISFKHTSESDAENYLANINNYLRTAAYRKNYQKHTKGINNGKYICLDFAYLQELSTIDMHFRFIVSKMCLDIEHDLKVKMLKDIESDPSTDGYDIVKCFLAQNTYIIGKLEATSSSPFTSDLIHKYFRFLYKGIIIKHNKTEPTYTKTSLFLCEKRRFFMARTEKGVVATI